MTMETESRNVTTTLDSPGDVTTDILSILHRLNRITDDYGGDDITDSVSRTDQFFARLILNAGSSQVTKLRDIREDVISLLQGDSDEFEYLTLRISRVDEETIEVECSPVIPEEVGLKAAWRTNPNQKEDIGTDSFQGTDLGSVRRKVTTISGHKKTPVGTTFRITFAHLDEEKVGVAIDGVCGETDSSGFLRRIFC